MSDAWKVFAVAVLAALAWAVAPVAQAEPPIRIGASLWLTGTLAVGGHNLHHGYQLCVKHMNEKGGVLGRKLELVLYDDGSDRPRPSASTRSSSRRTRVHLVFGPLTSPIAETVASVTEKHKRPMVAPTASATPIFTL